MLSLLKDIVILFLLALFFKSLPNIFAIVDKDDIIVCQHQAATLKWPGTTTSTNIEYLLWYNGSHVIARWTKEEGFVEIPSDAGRLKYIPINDIMIWTAHHTDSGTYQLNWKLKSAMVPSKAAINLQVIVPPTSWCIPNVTLEGGSLFATLPQEGCGIPHLTPKWKNGIQKFISDNVSVLDVELELLPKSYTACASGKSIFCFHGDVDKLCSHYTVPALQPQNDSSPSSGVVIAVLIAIPVLLALVGILVWWKWEYIKRKLFCTSIRNTAEKIDAEMALIDSSSTDLRLNCKAAVETVNKDSKLQEQFQMQQEQKSSHTLEADEQLISKENLQQPQHAPVLEQQNKKNCSEKMGAKFPQFKEVASRLMTFEDWAVDNHMKPEELAVAGFFYNGVGDGVTCFFCGLVLGDWASGNNAWAEHAMHSASCEHVRSKKMAGSSPGLSDEIELTSQEYLQQPQQALGIPPVDGQQHKLEIQDETVQDDQCALNKRDEKNQKQIIDGHLHCRTCQIQMALVTFLPCLHNTACFECARKLAQCNFCEKEIFAFVQPYAKQ